MDYRFFLTDRKTGERIEILEPVKFDGFTPFIKRGSYYGMSPDESESDIEFDREAGYAFLKAAYEKYGVDAEIDFLCEYTCDNRAWEEYYSGQVDFAATYEERYRKWCRVATNVMANDVRAVFLEKRDDEIDLDALVSRGGQSLSKYNSLGREILLPAKTIKTISEAAQEYPDGEEQGQVISAYFTGFITQGYDICGDVATLRFVSNLGILLNTAKYEENAIVNIGLSESEKADAYQFNYPMLIVEEEEIKYKGGHLQVDISGVIKVDGNNILGTRISPIKLKIGNDIITIGSEETITVCKGGQYDFRVEYSQIIPEGFEGDIALDIFMQTYANTGGDGSRELTLIINDGSYIRFTTNSQYPATRAKSYLIHETLARVAEYLTDGKLTVRSDFYGRTDSEIHRTPTDGNASLRAVTNGYLMRRAVMTDGSTPAMFVSWKKLFEALQAIDNVGFCFEDGGVIRVEPAEYFYRDDIIMTCNDINEYTKKFDAENNIRSVKTGYKKWLSDEYNSIDGFHTTREYHTALEKAVSAKEYFSELIADGYAIEATRRRQLEDASKDWQYDNDLFIIDLKRGSGTFEVNTGATQTDGTLIDPDTIYNARLSPARMAMRHFADVTRAVPPVYSRTLKFSAAEGYSNAKMRAEGNYIIEKSAIVENQDISVSDFADDGSLRLNVAAELMTFAYPIKPYEFRHIKANPYGLVDADGRLGWVKELEWETGKETANFTLILVKS